MFLGILAGDIIRLSRVESRENHLSEVLARIRSNRFGLEFLEKTAGIVRNELDAYPDQKKILAIGEIFVLYNDFLNDFTFNALEQDGYRITFAPLAEYLWMIWRDYAFQNPQAVSPEYARNLDEFMTSMHIVGKSLEEFSPFDKAPERLVEIADRTVGYYAGAGGRYRESKQLSNSVNVDGIINVFSMYENTGITLKTLHGGFEAREGKPVLNLTFDGNPGPNDKTRIESFVHYL